MADLDRLLELIDNETLTTHNYEEIAERLPTQQELADLIVLSNKVQLRPFPKKYPIEWFQKLQNEFRIYDITDNKMKYDILLRHLEPRIISQIRWRTSNHDNIEQSELYDHLKKELLVRYAMSTNYPEYHSVRSQVRYLLKDVCLESKKPSALWSEMVNAAGEFNEEEEILKERWLELLPFEISNIIKIFVKGTMEEHLRCADELALEWEPTPSSYWTAPQEGTSQSEAGTSQS